MLSPRIPDMKMLLLLCVSWLIFAIMLAYLTQQLCRQDQGSMSTGPSPMRFHWMNGPFTQMVSSEDAENWTCVVTLPELRTQPVSSELQGVTTANPQTLWMCKPAQSKDRIR